MSSRITFFVPGTSTPEDARTRYEAIKRFLGVNGFGSVSNRKIESISFRDEGRDAIAKVGKACPINSEVVCAILYEPGRRLYHVCTENRGVRRGLSILVGESE